MNFQDAVRTCLQRKYADFGGRARRSEFWFFALFNILVQLVAGALDAVIFGSATIFGAVAALAMLLPGIAVGARRLHDTGRSGWWLLIAFVPLIGGLLLIYFYILQGDAGPNRYGEDPRGGTPPFTPAR
jgi:uncharacterized membrane protein YhaH (DUF805 family)